MYILIIAGGYPQYESSLSGIFEFDQAKSLKALGHKIVFLSLDLRSILRRRKLGKYWTKKEEIDIINLSFPLGNLPDVLFRLIGQCLIQILFKEIKEKHGRPDIIHAHFTVFGNIATVIKKKYNIPLVITEHSSKVRVSGIENSIIKLGKITYPKADKLISVSSLLSKNIKKHWDCESIVIHNIVDTTQFHYQQRNKKEKFTFISVGNLIHRKGFDLLIKAFQKANFNDKVSLKIIGDGPLKKDLQREINTTGLINQIELLGQMNRESISNIMAECDAFVLASRNETFGVVYIEAMLTGLPVIATACGGPEDFVNVRNGMLIPTDQVEALSEALKDMHNNIYKFDSSSISNECLQNFSPETIAKKLTDVYELLIR